MFHLRGFLTPLLTLPPSYLFTGGRGVTRCDRGSEDWVAVKEVILMHMDFREKGITLNNSYDFTCKKSCMHKFPYNEQ